MFDFLVRKNVCSSYNTIRNRKDLSSNGAPTPSDKSYLHKAQNASLVFYIVKFYKSSKFKRFCKNSVTIQPSGCLTGNAPAKK